MKNVSFFSSRDIFLVHSTLTRLNQAAWYAGHMYVFRVLSAGNEPYTIGILITCSCMSLIVAHCFPDLIHLNY